MNRVDALCSNCRREIRLLSGSPRLCLQCRQIESQNSSRYQQDEVEFLCQEHSPLNSPKGIVLKMVSDNCRELFRL